MGQLQQAGGAGEAPQRKVGPQAVADHRDVQVYGDHEQLLGLLCGKELALVAQHAGQLGGLAGFAHHLEHIHVRADQAVGLAVHAQAADQFAAAFGVHLRLEDQHLHALLFIIVGHLHQGCALAAVHGTIAKIQFCHGVTPGCAGGSPGSSGCRPGERSPLSHRGRERRGRSGRSSRSPRCPDPPDGR